jgi:hypothetical protein
VTLPKQIGNPYCFELHFQKLQEENDDNALSKSSKKRVEKCEVAKFFTWQLHNSNLATPIQVELGWLQVF